MTNDLTPEVLTSRHAALNALHGARPPLPAPSDDERAVATRALRRFDERTRGPAGTRGIAQSEIDMANALRALLASRPTPPEDVAGLIDQARTVSGILEGYAFEDNASDAAALLNDLADALSALSSHPDEETVTSEPDVTWPADLRESSRARASRELIREANAVRDLDGTGIVGRLADMLAGWLPIPESEGRR